MNHELILEAFPATKDIKQLNTGTRGFMPEPALKRYLRAVEDFEQMGILPEKGVENTRKALAELLGCEPELLAFTGNATDGTNLVLAGLEWKKGDEVVITDEEHESLYHPLLYLQRTQGIRVRWVKVSPDPGIMLNRLGDATSEKTRLLAFSHVTCETGTRLPAGKMCAWAETKGISTLVDGAQSLGVFPIDVNEMGCDFFTSNGHKWLMGPQGTGIFYARQPNLLTPAHVGAGSLEHVDIETGQADPWNSGRRFEYGTRALALLVGLGYSIEWLGETIGWDNITAHIADLSDLLKEEIQRRPYLKLLTPEPFDESSGLTSFVMSGDKAGDLSRGLMQEQGVRVRVIPHYNAIRISTALFNNKADIDALMDGLDRRS